MVEGQLVFVIDEGFQFIGKIVWMFFDSGWLDRVDYIVKIYFGQISIWIEIYEIVNKEYIKLIFELD